MKEKEKVLLKRIFSISYYAFHSLLNDKILDWSKLRAFADNKIKVLKMMIFVFDRVEKNVENRRKCWLLAFSPFSTMFSKAFYPWSLKAGIVW